MQSFSNFQGVKTEMYLNCCLLEDQHWTQQPGAASKELREQNQSAKQ